MEVKGVAKSISLTHLRQLNDYLLTYEEETGKECKGILFGNAWRNTRPEMRGTKDTPEFPNNVVKRAEQWGISLVSSKAFFAAFVRALRAPHLSNDVLTTLTRSSGQAFPPDERSSGTEASHNDDRSGSRTGSVPSDGGDEEKPEGDRQVEETPDAAIESRPEGAHRD